MNRIPAKRKDELIQILGVFAELDRIRWQGKDNYNLINYCDRDLKPYEKILTHWLCYITDRQMPFQRIWEVGGFVISRLVKSYCCSTATARNVLDTFVVASNSATARTTDLALVCDYAGDNVRLERFGIQSPEAEFKSRFMPGDLVQIYRTLEILDRVAGRNIIRYMHDVATGCSDRKTAVGRMAIALDVLTYRTKGKVSGSNYRQRLDQEQAVIEEEFGNYKPTQFASLGFFAGFRRWDRKRLWCSLRDYLKSPEFNDVYMAGLRDIEVKTASDWHRSCSDSTKSFEVFELPGDRWNNDQTFRKGLFYDILPEDKKNWKMPKATRWIFDTLESDGLKPFYPEQLDVTFDFVPRMCDRQMCAACPFGNGISKVCHNQAGLLCSVALVACGYKHVCDPDKCDLKNDYVRGVCQSSGAEPLGGSVT